MGNFSKIAAGLRRTKEAFSKKFYELFKGRALDDDFYDELEMALISSDVGVETASQVVEELKDRCYEKRISVPEDAKSVFADILQEMIDYEIPPYEYPFEMLADDIRQLAIVLINPVSVPCNMRNQKNLHVCLL